MKARKKVNKLSGAEAIQEMIEMEDSGHTQQHRYLAIRTRFPKFNTTPYRTTANA